VCPKCGSFNTLVRDDDKINNISVIRCVKCGYRHYDTVEIKSDARGKYKRDLAVKSKRRPIPVMSGG